MFKIAFAAVSLLSLASSSPLAPTPRQVANPIQTVHIGLDEGKTLRFDPPFLQGVKQGTIVHFDFNAKNHTLTESTFDKPCTKLVKDGSIDTNFDHAVASDSENKPWDFTFPDSSPRYFYCKQANGTPNGHCGKGMVFGINIDQGTFDAFQKNALAQGGSSTTGPQQPITPDPDQIAIGSWAYPHANEVVAWVPTKTTVQQACSTHTSLKTESSGLVTGKVCDNKFSVGSLRDVSLQCDAGTENPSAVLGPDGKKLENCVAVQDEGVNCGQPQVSIRQLFLCSKA